MLSTVSTPILGPTKSATALASAAAASPSPGLAVSAPVADSSFDDIPPLALGVLTACNDQVDALKLVADSIAQQRQTASRSLAVHPLNLAGLATALAVTYQLNPRQDDYGILISLVSGVVMAYLLGIRYIGAQYLTLAEALGWSFLVQNNPEDHAGQAKKAKKDTDPPRDLILGARFGEQMVGALVLRLEEDDGEAGPLAPRKKGRSSTYAGSATASFGHGIIRAWTTRLRYRRRGIGTDLLREAVRVTRARFGMDASVAFAADHANSTMILPERYNRPFRATGKIAVHTLDKVLAEGDVQVPTTSVAGSSSTGGSRKWRQ